VYPNPTVNGQLTVSLAEALVAGPVTITLSDMQGRPVATQVSTGQAQVPMRAALPAGLYLLQVSGALGASTQKVVVQ
jgi:arabinan endo-1,5-alpha-L-arabinosidase